MALGLLRSLRGAILSLGRLLSTFDQGASSSSSFFLDFSSPLPSPAPSVPNCGCLFCSLLVFTSAESILKGCDPSPSCGLSSSSIIKMVRPTLEDVPIDGGGSYTSIEMTMKKKKKWKHPPPEENVTQLVASNVDPSFLVRVPKDNRVNMEGVLDGKMQSVVEEWGGNALSTPVVDSNSPTVGTVSSPPVGGGAIAPPSVVDKDCAPRILDVSNDGDDRKSQAEPEKPTPKLVSPPIVGGGSDSGGLQFGAVTGGSLVFQAGGSGGGSGGESDELTGRRPKVADKAKRRVGGERSRPPGVSLGGGRP
ncbi:hypothetical protein LIER_06114 [Lithospermum erythrorhizon]|uniref:Uncharacterized protein n=1 Tax=Lithospermum erythrorhizon TaxID=34254 RepID=A0AAV3P341_LITER